MNYEKQTIEIDVGDYKVFVSIDVSGLNLNTYLPVEISAKPQVSPVTFWATNLVPTVSNA